MARKKKTRLVTDIKKYFTKLGNDIAGASGKEAMWAYGVEAVKMIQRRTRAGFAVHEMGGEKVEFAKFSDRYLKYRKANAPLLNPRTSPEKRNNTFTGQMIFMLMVIKATARKVIIDTVGTRDDGQKNGDIARWLSSGEYGGPPRPFAYLARTELAKLKRLWKIAFAMYAKRKS